MTHPRFQWLARSHAHGDALRTATAHTLWHLFQTHAHQIDVSPVAGLTPEQLKRCVRYRVTDLALALSSGPTPPQAMATLLKTQATRIRLGCVWTLDSPSLSLPYRASGAMANDISQLRAIQASADELASTFREHSALSPHVIIAMAGHHAQCWVGYRNHLCLLMVDKHQVGLIASRIRSTLS